MKSIKDEHALFSSLLDLLEAHLGANTELVLYELKPDGSAAIADIRNGRISGGAAGIGKDILNGNASVWLEREPQKLYNMIDALEQGTVLRSSAVFIYDDAKCAVGCLCISQDITKTLEAERVIHNLNQYHGDSGSSFATDMSSVLDNLISEAAGQIDAPYEKMDKEQKIAFIRYLDQRGAFLVTKAGDRVCALLGISKYTMYAYLDLAREHNA